MNPQTIDQLKARMAEPCNLCVKEIFKYLMDPQVLVLLEPWLAARNNLIQLHVHGHSALSQGSVNICFLMATYITPEIQILYYTPASPTVEGAFEILKEVVAREEKRLCEKKGDADDVGRRTKKKRRKTGGASANESGGTEGRAESTG